MRTEEGRAAALVAAEADRLALELARARRALRRIAADRPAWPREVPVRRLMRLKRMAREALHDVP